MPAFPSKVLCEAILGLSQANLEPGLIAAEIKISLWAG